MRIQFALFAVFISFAVSAQQLKITNGPYLQNMEQDNVTIIWTTDKDAVSWLELAPAGDDSFYAGERTRFFEAPHGSKKIGKLHRITVSGLTAGTEYRYRIFSKEVLNYEGHRVMYGDIASSDVYRDRPFSFKTLDPEKSSIAFKVVNDIHSKNENLESMLSKVTKENTDLILFNGDMVSIFNEEKEIFTGFMDTAVRLFAKEVPVFYARGNHETRGKASSRLYDYFPTNNGHFYYTFRHGPIQFLVLDGGEDKPDSDIEYSELAQFDNYRTEEKNWLRKAVREPDFQSAPFRVAVLHIPPVGSTWHGTKEIAEKFLPLLNEAGIDIMLCGHLHNYQLINKGDDKNVNFPILVNDDETYLDVTADDKKIDVFRKDLSGKIVDSHSIKRQH